MSDLRKAAEMALEFVDWFCGDDHSVKPKNSALESREALRQALAPKELPRPDEPIWVVDEKGNKQLLAKQNRAPPKREWAGLSDVNAVELWQLARHDIVDFARAIEAKLKEKNS